MSSPSRTRLRPLVAEDIEECARIAGEAFLSDRHTQFKSLSVADPYNHEEGMLGALNHWFRREPGSVELTVAVDSHDDEILGWVVWGFHGFEPLPPKEQQQQPETEDKLIEKETSEKTSPSNNEKPARKEHQQSMRRQIENFTSADLESWMNRLMPPGTKCMFICSIVVSPRHREKGVGRLLVNQGTRRADAENVFCWVHSSEAGAKFFPRFGFREVGNLDVDLDAFNVDNVKPPEGGSKWGRYVFRYMRREPHQATK